MIECGSLEYAQARLQARHGARADDVAWQRLETTREYGALLDAARSSPLRAWVVGLTPRSSAREIEAVMLGHWRAVVDETAGWMPLAWQPAITWCALAPLLPALQHLVRGGPVRPWMHDDALLRVVCAAAPAARAAALGGTAAAALAPAWPAPQTLGTAWWREWESLLPRPLQADDSLRTVAALLQAHGSNFATAPAGSGTLLRRALQDRLTPWLRRAAAKPAAAFVHLALCALDLERLRGELLRRVLFPATSAPMAEAA
ncbi:MAG: hypothetical protein Q7U73_07265 [Rubrivivax sp.]|nr:hypothetical protein [Rubrivivax sp.]